MKESLKTILHSCNWPQSLYFYAGFEIGSKEESEVNCLPTDTYLQKVACAFNMNRDRALVTHIQNLFNSYKKILVVYGAGHFVQEYPAFLKTFAKPPEYLKIEK